MHYDIKGHTGAAVCIGRVRITRMSKKQKINTTKSTLGEIVGVYDASSQVMSTQYFLSNQGFEIDRSILYQDNKNEILLGENGCESSYNRKNHINIKYFDMKNRISSGEAAVEKFLTDDMMADYFTNPLQGKCAFWD